ncbi:hypothetical protein CR513_01878, partial [Mucuna pruriens]
MSGKSKKKKKEENRKESLLVGPKEVRRVLLAKREPLFAFPTSMLLNASLSLNYLPTSMQDFLEEYQDIFLKDVPHGLLPLKDLTLEVTLPNRTAYRTKPKEAKVIKKIGKLIEK